MSELLSDLRTLRHLAMPQRRTGSHADKMEGFYQEQAEHYDSFRRRLLHGRPTLYGAITPPRGGVWVDLGGGTGGCIDYLQESWRELGALYIVDLSPSLLKVARRRIERAGATNAHAVEADATRFVPPEGGADVVTLSYSLTMIPEWSAVIEHAWTLLSPGGKIGVTDFYVSSEWPAPGRVAHSSMSRLFWPRWFARDSVHLDSRHLDELDARFTAECLIESTGKIPYFPLARAPYYVFIGRKVL